MPDPDSIWLSHLEGRENKWLALAGEYPYTLVGEGDDPVSASKAATENGYPDATLYKVKPNYQIKLKPFKV